MSSDLFDPLSSNEGISLERFQNILLDVWREACRHIQIGESAVTFFGMLRAQMPAAGVVIHWLDPEHQRVTVAASVPEAALAVDSGAELSERNFRQLSAWIRRGELMRMDSAGRNGSPVASLFSMSAENSLLVAPLCGPNGTLGLFTVIPDKGSKLTKWHEDLLRVLQEPLAVALENDRRLHELAVLREAAEADRRSLLTRLGRNEMTDTLIGAETGLRKVLDRVRQCSRSLVPVLILGETGTGKEVIAREIHQGSGRSNGPFIRVNCGAIPPELIDSQLFGHEKGSFTGAVEARQGWFERADGGTLFLDEIGELPADAQVRFLRVLQDGFVERVGSHKVIQVDVRVVAATHRNLAEMVTDGGFREDLWYRIAVFPILIPPLRERIHDIPALIDHFVRKAGIRFGLPSVQATPSDIQRLQSYDWPGNIRELGAVVDRAVILGEGRSLEIEAAMGTSQSASPGRRAVAAEEPSYAVPKPIPARNLESLEDAMRQQIEKALDATRGRIEGPHGAAALLRINPHTLRARMRKLQIDWSKYRVPRLP